MSDSSVIHRFHKELVTILISGVFIYTLGSIIDFQSANADECAPDADWSEKPCPAYGSGSEAELIDRWNKYYDMKGKDRMEAKKVEMDAAIRNGTFTEWIGYAPDNNLANRNVYFYYRLNNQAPLMVRDPASGQYFASDQDPSIFTYSPLSGDYYTKASGPPWYTTPTGLYVIIGIGSVGASASFYLLWKASRK